MNIKNKKLNTNWLLAALIIFSQNLYCGKNQSSISAAFKNFLGLFKSNKNPNIVTISPKIEIPTVKIKFGIKLEDYEDYQKRDFSESSSVENNAGSDLDYNADTEDFSMASLYEEDDEITIGSFLEEDDEGYEASDEK